MSPELLTTREAARRLGISVGTLYLWLAQSNAGEFALRGRPITIEYYQTGARGQGRIRIEAREIDRLKDAMLVPPSSALERRLPTQRQHYPGITVKLGRPDSAADSSR